jgi:streptogramin lyase
MLERETPPVLTLPTKPRRRRGFSWVGGVAAVLVVAVLTIGLAASHLSGVHVGKGQATPLPTASPTATATPSPAGIMTEFPLPTIGYSSDWITAGPDGNVWFTEHSGTTSQIGRITPAGRITEFPLMADILPGGITAGPDGNLWFTETVYGNNGAITGKIGRMTPADTFTEFQIATPNASPYAITAGPDGNLWFTETTINVTPLTGEIGRITSGR